MFLRKHFATRAISKHLEQGYRDVELGPVGFEPEEEYDHIEYHHAAFTAVSKADGKKVKGSLRYNSWSGIHRLSVEPIDGKKPDAALPPVVALPPPAVATPKAPNRLNL